MNLKLRIRNYIERYAPSEKKLREYISRKNHTIDISLFLNEIGYDEGLLCTLWVRSFIQSGKGKKEIKRKLLQKGYPKEQIESIFRDFGDELSNWDTYKNPIESRIQELFSRGKSKKMIATILIQKYPEFRENITEILDVHDDESSLTKEINKYLTKYDISYLKEKQKLYTALMRKGFRSHDITSHLSKIDS